MSRSGLLLVVCGVLCVLTPLTRGQAAPQSARTSRRQARERGPQGGLTLDFLFGRLRSLERKFTRSQQQLSNTQAQIKSLEGRVGQGGGGGGGGGSSGAVSRKFSDLGPCPIRAQGFYFAPKFRSCYRLEPSDVLVNQTEAARICRQFSSRSDVVSIETEAEQDFLKTRWQEERGVGSLVRFWTSSRRNAGKWSWEQRAGSIPMGYTNWIPTTEHSDDRFSCMAVYSNEAFTWIDVACWAPHLVTCEVNL